MNTTDTTPTPMTDLERWCERLAGSLGLDSAEIVDIPLLLDLARDAAHGVARPAAPLSTFLVGYALARRGGAAGDLRELAAATSELAAAWTP